MKSYILYFTVFLFLGAGILFAQDRTISGKVTDEKGAPLSRVTIVVKGTTIGTYSKADGTYIVNAPMSASTLIFKYIGMKTQEIEISGRSDINIKLIEDKIMMDEVVVTAIGIEKDKRSLGYAYQEVSGSTLSEAKAVNMVNDLTGKVAGVQINSSAGTPGASSYMLIRGASSILGENQPLFVVDGIPIDNSMTYSGNPDNQGNNLLYGVAYSNRGIDINPDDIESMTVLKGPAATALYGMRAASGAVIITTKKGHPTVGGKINVSFTTTATYEVVDKLPDLQNQFAQGTNGTTIYSAGSSKSTSWGPNIDTLYWDGSTNNAFDKHGNIVGASNPKKQIKLSPYDNTKNFFQVGSNYTQSLSMTGGTDYGTFLLSLSNNIENGMIPSSSFERNTVKLTGDARISTRLKASGSIMFTNSNGKMIQQGSNTSGVMLGLLRTPITFDNSNGYGTDAYKHTDAYMFADGSQRDYRGGPGYDNPFWTVEQNPFTDKVNRYIGYIQLNYLVSDWMDIMYKLGTDNYTENRYQIFAVNSNTNPAGQIFEHDLFSSDLNSDLMFNFNYKLTDDIYAKLMIGNNLYQEKFSYIYDQGDGLTIPNFYYFSNTASQLVRQSDNTLRRAAVYGDLTLDYRQWIYLDFTLRNDWSTSLPKNQNSFLYGAGNLSFIYTEALKDMFANSFLSFGKVRFNYAVAGKDAPIYGTSTPFVSASYSDGWTNGVSFPWNTQTGYYLSASLGSSTLKPELTKSWEIGFDFNLFENFADLDITYYNSKSSDQITVVPIARTSGFFYELMNAGEISNKGVEIVLSFNLIKTDFFKWTLGFNYSKNTNKVESLAPGITDIFINGFTGGSIRAKAGDPYGSIYGIGWLRDKGGNILIDDNPQDPLYGFPILDQNEKNFGSATPNWLMGIRNNFNFKFDWGTIDLGCVVDIKNGGKIWDGTRGALVYYGMAAETADRGSQKTFSGVKAHYDATGTLINSGAANDIKVTVGQSWYQGNGGGFVNTEDYVEDAGWVRLRELSLTYTLPKEYVDATPFSDLSVTFTGFNLLLSSKYKGVDPETSLVGATNAQGIDYFNMPGIRSYSVSIGIKF